MSAPSWAVPGAKVVCVRDNWTGGQFLSTRNLPKLRCVYTVRETRWVEGFGLLLMLAEIVNPPFAFREGLIEPGFATSFFRPARTIEDDVSLFKHLLNTQPVGEDA